MVEPERDRTRAGGKTQGQELCDVVLLSACKEAESLRTLACSLGAGEGVAADRQGGEQD